ncbi:MAG: hypothetical protein LQ350_006359 [Teloschistes chrysophthalmus]|nr:MAG: hypothetical protein LQ350_006359 [Niorma chrysophthalma]
MSGEKRAGDPLKDPPNKRSKNPPAQGPVDLIRPYNIPANVNQMSPEDVLGMGHFGKDVYSQDLYTIFTSETYSDAQKTTKNSVFRMLVTLEKILGLATESRLVKHLQLLVFDHIMLMCLLCLPLGNEPIQLFPNHEDRFKELAQIFEGYVKLDAGSSRGHHSPWKTRIEGLLVDPSRVTPLDGISGNAPAKKKIKSAMFISTRAQHVEEVATRGTLLHGPSGTGKSLLAVAGAAFSGRFKVYRVKGSDLIAKWQGSSEQYIAAIFAIAEPNGPSAISVHVTEVRFWGTGTTNNPHKLDEAFARRFESIVYVGLPTTADRIDIMRIHLSKYHHVISDGQLEDLARRFSGFTGSSVVKTIKAALTPLVLEWESATHFREVTVHGQQLYCPCASNEKDALARTYEDFERDGTTSTVTTRPLTFIKVEDAARVFERLVPTSVMQEQVHVRWLRDPVFGQ